MNYVNGCGIPFFSPRSERKKRFKGREMPPPHFSLFLALPLNNLSCWQRGPWVLALGPCEKDDGGCMVGGGGGSEHNDISEELKRQAGGKEWRPCCWMA